jgi:hypothetical protein
VRVPSASVHLAWMSPIFGRIRGRTLVPATVPMLLRSRQRQEPRQGIQSSSDFGGEKGEGYLSSEPIVAEGGSDCSS